MAMEASPTRPHLNLAKLQFNLRAILVFVAIVATCIAAHQRYQRWKWSRAISAKSYFVGDLINAETEPPDFGQIIEKIQTTVAKRSWAVAGGQGTVQPFSPNLSVVVNQGQAVHDQLSAAIERWRNERMSNQGSSPTTLNK